ncbi:uncharacterized protein Dana_GF27481, isoform A [Drosophila ananassae]|uniref:Uncharacterized protein, isoform A n=1 Tax=Drosophila ananassae TaxID=7217 RepID=A0A0P8XNZ7_DROAN|nr:uncharacterized protein LOC26514890 isoform X2 [Drosophila ananassae]KPU76337.1 uncharacterized protein Dana_GF27481, isoform A [Drosophila ananassae]
MFRKTLNLICAKKVLASSFFRKKGNCDPIDNGGDLSKIAGETTGCDAYHVKVHQVPKGKEAKIIELITRIEALQMKIKSLEKAKSAKAKAAAAVLKVLLQDIKKALVQLRMKNE